jgi:tetratricopeptide (TPR) repeat protein
MTRAWTLLAVTALAAGCVTPYGEGQSALQKGRYVEAEGYFNQALASDPSRTDALVGLGIAQYKQGEIDQASDTLQKALQVRPNEPNVRLYLGLAYLRNQDTLQAEQQLTALRSLNIDPRVAQQIDRALEVIRQGPLSNPVRDFLVGSLETQAQLSRDAQEALLQAQRAQAFYFPYYPYIYPYFGYPYVGYPYVGAPFAPCVLVRRGGGWFCI